MKALNYITYDAWWDTDITVLESLNTEFDLTVHVINSAGNKKFKNKKLLGIKIIEYDEHYSGWNFLRVKESIKIFISLYKYCKKDSIVFYIIGSDIILKLCFWFFFSYRNVIISLHNYIEHSDSQGGINEVIKNFYYRKYKNFHFFSKTQFELFTKKYPQKKSFFSLMPPKNYGELLERQEDNKITFLFFGFIRDYKRLDLFINAANKIDNEKARFYIAGACDNWNYYNKMITSSNFKLKIDFIENEEIPEIFSEADYLVLPYDDSTQSGPSLIAINYSKPIIASDLPVFKDIIQDGYNGFFFKKGSVESLVAVINHCLNLIKIEYDKLVDCQRENRDNLLLKDSLCQRLMSFLNSEMF